MDADNPVVVLLTTDEASMLQGLVSTFRLAILADLSKGSLNAQSEVSHRADLAIADSLTDKLRGPEWRINRTAERLAEQIRGAA